MQNIFLKDKTRVNDSFYFRIGKNKKGNFPDIDEINKEIIISYV